MLAVKVQLRKLDLIELGEGSSSPSKAEVYSYGFIVSVLTLAAGSLTYALWSMAKKLMTMPSPTIW
jgi:hypothetical protein